MRDRAFRLIAAVLCVTPIVAHSGASEWWERLAGKAASPATLDVDTVARGLKEALSKGAARAVDQLGRRDGYFGNRWVRIPMPEHLERLDKTLRRLGQERYADEFIVSMNRAAEAAAPQAADMLKSAIRAMTVRDALDILNGPQDAATQYFRRHADAGLRQRFRPVVTQATAKAGVTRAYKRMVAQSGVMQPWVDPARYDLDDYVTRKALDGLYYMIAQEEARIRRDPVARTTELLRTVFGTK